MITPSDTPSSPEGYAEVTPHGRGPAPYDIQAASDEGTVQAAFAASVADAGAGVLYPRSARQRETEALLSSPAGFAVDGYDVDAGYSGQGVTGDGGWPSNVEPGG